MLSRAHPQPANQRLGQVQDDACSLGFGVCILHRVARIGLGTGVARKPPGSFVLRSLQPSTERSFVTSKDASLFWGYLWECTHFYADEPRLGCEIAASYQGRYFRLGDAQQGSIKPPSTRLPSRSVADFATAPQPLNDATCWGSTFSGESHPSPGLLQLAHNVARCPMSRGHPPVPSVAIVDETSSKKKPHNLPSSVCAVVLPHFAFTE